MDYHFFNRYNFILVPTYRCFITPTFKYLVPTIFAKFYKDQFLILPVMFIRLFYLNFFDCVKPNKHEIKFLFINRLFMYYMYHYYYKIVKM